MRTCWEDVFKWEGETGVVYGPFYHQSVPENNAKDTEKCRADRKFKCHRGLVLKIEDITYNN